MARLAPPEGPAANRHPSLELQATFEKLLSKLDDYQQSGEPLNIILAYSAFTSDIITEYAFAKEYNYLDAPDFNATFFDMMVGVHETGTIAKQFGFFLPLLDSLPDWIVSKIDPGMNLFCELRRFCREGNGRTT